MFMNKKYSYSYGHDDVYCYENSDVLRNKLNVKDADKKRVFGKSFFLNIHRLLFEDIYDWAGKIRTVDIAKGTLFCRTFAIQNELNRIFQELADEEMIEASHDSFNRNYAKMNVIFKKALVKD